MDGLPELLLLIRLAECRACVRWNEWTLERHKDSFAKALDAERRADQALAWHYAKDQLVEVPNYLTKENP